MIGIVATVVDDDADSRPPGGQTKRRRVIGIVAAQINDHTVPQIAVRARSDDASVGVIAAQVDDQRGALLQVIGVGAVASYDQQSVGRLLCQEQISGDAGNRVGNRGPVVEGDLQLLEKFPVADP